METPTAHNRMHAAEPKIRVGGAERAAMRARTLIFVTLIALAVIGSAMWLLVPVESRYQGKTLQTHFDQLRGHNGDPVIPTLRDIGPDAVAFLARQMRTKDSFLRARYVTLWPKLPAFVKSKLKQPMSASAIRGKAVAALRQMGPRFTASAVGFAALSSALNHPDSELRLRAEGALGDLGPQATAAVPALIKSVEQRMRTSTGHTDINGIWALGKIGPDAKTALPLLESIMKQNSGRELVYAAEAVLKIGGNKAAAIAALEKGLEDPDPQARREAVEVLTRSGQPAKVRASGLGQESSSR